jgi:hypothetical protein
MNLKEKPFSSLFILEGIVLFITGIIVIGYFYILGNNIFQEPKINVILGTEVGPASVNYKLDHIISEVHTRVSLIPEQLITLFTNTLVTAVFFNWAELIALNNNKTTVSSNSIIFKILSSILLISHTLCLVSFIEAGSWLEPNNWSFINTVAIVLCCLGGIIFLIGICILGKTESGDNG